MYVCVYKWEFQDPKIEVLYHFLGHTLWGYSQKHRPYIGLVQGAAPS